MKGPRDNETPRRGKLACLRVKDFGQSDCSTTIVTTDDQNIAVAEQSCLLVKPGICRRTADAEAVPARIVDLRGANHLRGLFAPRHQNTPVIEQRGGVTSSFERHRPRCFEPCAGA
jgi:hypothetical protein